MNSLSLKESLPARWRLSTGSMRWWRSQSYIKDRQNRWEQQNNATVR